LGIAEHFAKPALVLNCTQTVLVCRITANASSNINVYWTFQGENASKLPDVRIEANASDTWHLIVSCATPVHAGTYQCNAHPLDNTEVLYRKEAVIQVFGECCLFAFLKHRYLNENL
ncbi:uncharacterized protein B4U80_01499, partial [Leptotrombidium deliense]